MVNWNARSSEFLDFYARGFTELEISQLFSVPVSVVISLIAFELNRCLMEVRPK